MSPHWPTLGALAAVLVLGGGFALEVTSVPTVRIAVSAETVAPDAALPAIPGRALAAGTAREIIDRPLFFASRRPLPPEPPAVAEAKPEPIPPVDFTLVGTVLSGSSRVALIKPDKTALVELALGQAVGAWTVSAIDADRIVVRHGGTEQLLGLREFGSSRALPAAMRPLVLTAPQRPPGTDPSHARH